MTTQDITNKALNDTLNTVGYSESNNHEAYKLGAEMALRKAAPMIDELQRNIIFHSEERKRAENEVQSDIRTFRELLRKYLGHYEG